MAEDFDIDNLDVNSDISGLVDHFNALQSKDMPLKDISVPHEIKKALYEDYFVPAHKPRKNSKLYTQTHKNLINIKDTPCYICGVSKKTLKDPTKNPYGATQLETHHVKIEWSLANAVDWAVMKQAYPDFPNWDKVDPADQSTYFNFVDHEFNMLVLCDIHHRGKLHGIHAIEHAVWQAQKYMAKDFKYIPDIASKDLGENTHVPDMS